MPAFMTLNDLSQKVWYSDAFLQVKSLQAEAHLLLQKISTGNLENFQTLHIARQPDERHLEALRQKQKASTRPRRSGGLFG